MNETYAECLVARKKKPADMIIKVILIAVTAVLFLMGLMRFVILIAAVIVGALTYLFIQRVDVEYEYLYLDRELSIDRIIAKQKRKKDRVLELEKMEILAPEKSYLLDSYKNRAAKTVDYSSQDPSAKRYVMIYNGEETLRVLLEPDGDILRCMKNVYPRQVHTD